ncbi:hypothetical protein BASA83_012949 [Batrachochytrium salamandrivorans]|nr:hypothetical protein BASA83_012949 [Batrachochytrium salamandrivorans]
MVFQLQDKRYDTDRKKIATLGTLLTDKAFILVQPLYRTAGTPISTGTIAALRSQFYSGLSSEIKDHLVHCESRYRWLLLWTKQSDRQQDFERKTGAAVQPRIIPTKPAPNSTCFSNLPSAVPAAPICFINSNHQQIQQPFCPTTATPVQPRLTSNDMDIDFARRGPLTNTERQQRPQRQVQAIAMEDSNIEVSGNDLWPTLSRDLDSAVKLLPPEA